MKCNQVATTTLLIMSSIAFAQIPQYDGKTKSDDMNLVGFSCDVKTATLEVGYFTAYNLPAERKMEFWDTFNLKTNRTDIDAVEAIRTLKRTCKLGKNSYVVLFRGVPGNWNLNRMCGARTYAGVQIRRNGNVIYDDNFESCGSAEVVTSVVIKSRRKAVVNKIASRIFNGI